MTRASGPSDTSLPAGRTAFRAVEHNPAYRQVADELRRAISDGRLAPGDELPTERDLSAQFGVSRTTVREALRVLQAQGFVRSAGAAPLRSVVSSNPGLLGGAYDQLLARDEVTILDMIPFRAMLEMAAIERAVLDQGEQLAALRRAAEQVGRAADDELFGAYMEFHSTLVRCSGNQALVLTMEAVQGAMRDHLAAAVAKLTGPDGTWTAGRLAEVYLGIVVALEGGDAAGAGAELLAHVSDFYNELLSTPSSDLAADGA